MSADPDLQATMLATLSLGRADQPDAKPLSIGEWERFSKWLGERNHRPSALLEPDFAGLLAGWSDPSVTLARLELLFNRGVALAFATEKWERAGIRTIGDFQPEYPQRLKRRLKGKVPPLLFCCGDSKLLNSGGIAVVGSRNARSEELAFARRIGELAADSNDCLVSGGARGIDEGAMLGALHSEGNVVGVVAEGLLLKATSKLYRNHIREGRLALVSPYNPEAGWNTGHAMQRNRYIYCLADAAVVVCSTPGRGGTWNGATENLKANWVPVWAKRTDDSRSGNPKLVELGANWMPDTACGPLEALKRPANANANQVTTDKSIKEVCSVGQDQSVDAGAIEAAEVGSPNAVQPQEFYELFIAWFREISSDDPLDENTTAKKAGLVKPQVTSWLKRGAREGRLEARQFKGRIVYQHADHAGQPTFFGNLEGQE